MTITIDDKGRLVIEGDREVWTVTAHSGVFVITETVNNYYMGSKAIVLPTKVAREAARYIQSKLRGGSNE